MSTEKPDSATSNTKKAAAEKLKLSKEKAAQKAKDLAIPEKTAAAKTKLAELKDQTVQKVKEMDIPSKLAAAKAKISKSAEDFKLSEKLASVSQFASNFVLNTISWVHKAPLYAFTLSFLGFCVTLCLNSYMTNLSLIIVILAGFAIMVLALSTNLIIDNWKYISEQDNIFSASLAKDEKVEKPKK